MAEALPDHDAGLMLDMLQASRDALAFVEPLQEVDFLASRLHQYAVIRSLEIVGEAAGKVSAATCNQHPEVPWREMIGMRHRLIHGYAEVRLDLVWFVVRERLPALIITLDAILGDH
ncbi:hypothetical protein CCR97_12020 [Rhodoplanes elegans]|uniref:DUF86 domain-containing protein n=1 Tax=Rhodoplanes elegans TaxID=29408 RepID=A0A327KCJ6_9BRAD|nr:DUF86 domain-containing protein [Rhodoplanes elegans]MBK5958929.1 hypothetical protein [Rhodoplanes elegans]RAI35726.1 hypothetical protein CH338_18730 [Rhodoplanes elegans]